MTRLVGVFRLVASWIFTVAYVGSVVVLSLLSFGWFARRWGCAAIRRWARGMLRILGVALEIDNLELLWSPGPKVVTFNHSSQLDGYVTLAMLPDNGTIVVKREFLYYPLIGQAILLLGVLPLHRGAHDRAMKSLHRLARRIADRGMTVLIAPEGTRSGTDHMRQFKLGAFHLALESRAPIVPMVIIGARTLMPRGALVATPGTIHVRLLAPVHGERFRNPPAFAERVRSLYVSELEGRGNEPERTRHTG